jgi:hypothetical protein
MALKLELETLDGVDENLHDLYEEADGKYRLKVEGVEDVAPLKAKINELLGETKAEKAKRQALEAAQAEAEEARQKEKGEFKTLYEKTQAELERERQQAATFRQQIRDKELQGSAAQIAGELTRDTARAALLTKEAQALMKHTDEGVQYEIGGVPVDRAKVLDHLRTSYPFLADGTQASGGGATGGNGGAGSKPKGNFAGTREEREAAILAKFPDLAKGA